MKPAASGRAGWWLMCCLCLVLWGIWGFLSKLLADAIGAVEAQILFTLGMAPAALVAGASVKWRGLASSRRGVTYGLLNGLLTAAGTLCFFKALALGPASIVSPMIAVYPLGTVALAMLFLHERITVIQGLGAVCAVAGLALLS